ncbi:MULTISPECIES: GPW/gp25 family protein [Flavobacteriales]|uniref:Phage baseplate assembly protein W n=1 Tax=Owenweeksia hongkongensis (strain DSM 17368 / CIP 108786 / JCM 12287 / NRRL B-23963 / UST20020801) TaxID=926562 RepID=G8R6Y2_OWEHD|nr:GPW/gp25 family protein [Owenweeksia hongkongensis]AEV32317.1 phage baseplate assembly protein W [Owenweeksia hongkongensis DSM 17368]
MGEKDSFLGKGWAFPPTFHLNNPDGVLMTEGVQDIEQSLEILLTTAIGERLMIPEYGCDVMAFVFRDGSSSNHHFLKQRIKSAILRFEPRIDELEIMVDYTAYLDGVVSVHIDYRVISTNSRFNLVFPFYKVEGTDIPHLFRSE